MLVDRKQYSCATDRTLTHTQALRFTTFSQETYMHTHRHRTNYQIKTNLRVSKESQFVEEI